MTRLAAFLASLLLTAPLARAAASDVSASIWRISGDNIVLDYTFPKELGARLATPGRGLASIEMMGRYVLSRVSAQRQGQPCEALDQGYDLGRIDARYAGPGVYSFEILFRCSGKPGLLVLNNNSFFDLSPDQIGLASIHVLDLPPVSRVMTTGNTAVNIQLGQAPEPSWLAAYVSLGLKHTLGTTACACAAFGLLLLIRNRKELVTAVCGLLAGYLIAAWAAGAGGWIYLPPAGQAFGGFTVMFIGALLTARASGCPAAAALGLAIVVGAAAATVAVLGYGSAALCLMGAGIFGALSVPLYREETFVPWLLLVLAMLVALADGLSLPAKFAPLHRVISPAMAALLSYNMGALLGALTIFAAAAGARLLLQPFGRFRRVPLYLDLLTAALAGVGAFSMLVV